MGPYNTDAPFSSPTPPPSNDELIKQKLEDPKASQKYRLFFNKATKTAELIEVTNILSTLKRIFDSDYVTWNASEEYIKSLSDRLTTELSNKNPDLKESKKIYSLMESVNAFANGEILNKAKWDKKIHSKELSLETEKNQLNTLKEDHLEVAELNQLKERLLDKPNDADSFSKIIKHYNSIVEFRARDLEYAPITNPELKEQGEAIKATIEHELNPIVTNSAVLVIMAEKNKEIRNQINAIKAETTTDGNQALNALKHLESDLKSDSIEDPILKMAIANYLITARNQTDVALKHASANEAQTHQIHLVRSLAEELLKDFVPDKTSSVATIIEHETAVKDYNMALGMVRESDPTMQTPNATPTVTLTQTLDKQLENFRTRLTNTTTGAPLTTANNPRLVLQPFTAIDPATLDEATKDSISNFLEKATEEAFMAYIRRRGQSEEAKESAITFAQSFVMANHLENAQAQFPDFRAELEKGDQYEKILGEAWILAVEQMDRFSS